MEVIGPSPYVAKFTRTFEKFNRRVQRFAPLKPLPTRELVWWDGQEAELKEMWTMLTPREKKAARVYLGKDLGQMHLAGYC